MTIKTFGATLYQFLEGVPGWVQSHGAEIRLSARVCFACLAAFVISIVLHLPQGYWAMLTAVLVIQSNVGGSLKFAIERLIGTCGGAVYGAIIATLVPHNDPGMMAVALLIGIAPPALLAALNPSFRIAPVTVIIVLFSSTIAGHEIGVFQYAFDRVIEIGLGSVIGLFVSLVFLPARAHTQAAVSAGKVLDQMAAMLPMLLSGLSVSQDRVVILAHHDEIRKALSKLDVIAEEARRERDSHLAMGPDTEPLCRTLRRMRHDLVMLSRSCSMTLPETILPRLGPPIAAVTDAASSYLRNAATALQSQTPLADPTSYESAFEFYNSQMIALRQEQKFEDLPNDVVGRIFTLGFAIEQLHQNFRDLANRVADFEGNTGRKTAD